MRRPEFYFTGGDTFLSGMRGVILLSLRHACALLCVVEFCDGGNFTAHYAFTQRGEGNQRDFQIRQSERDADDGRKAGYPGDDVEQ